MISVKTVGRNDNQSPTAANYMDIYTYDIWAKGGYTYNERQVSVTVGVLNSQVLIARAAGVNVTAVKFDGKNGSSISLNPSKYFAGNVFDYSINNTANFTVTPKFHVTKEHPVNTGVQNFMNFADSQTFPSD